MKRYRNVEEHARHLRAKSCARVSESEEAMIADATHQALWSTDTIKRLYSGFCITRDR